MHLNAHVAISTEVMLACAERGIVILLHGEEETPVARLIGRASEATRLRQRLIDFSERPDWEMRYADWLRAMEHRMAGVLARRLDAPQHACRRPVAMRRWLAECSAALAEEKDDRLTKRLFHQFALATVQHQLHQRGIGAENELWTVGRPDLAADLAGLLAFRIETLRLGWLAARARSKKSEKGRTHPLKRRQIIVGLERQHARIERLSADLINRLHRWLIESA